MAYPSPTNQYLDPRWRQVADDMAKARAAQFQQPTQPDFGDLSMMNPGGAPVNLTPMSNDWQANVYGTPSMGIDTGMPKQPGAMAGQWGNVAMGAATIAGDTIGMANQSLDLGNAPGLVNSATGQPYYNTGDFQNRASGAKVQGVRGGEVAIGGLKGAALGTQIMPGIGTAIGAAVGALGSTIGGWIRGSKQRREKRRALRQAQGKQVAFNEASSDFNQDMMARQQYRQSKDLTNRMYNLYSQPS
jgi:hypothetical protein